MWLLLASVLGPEPVSVRVDIIRGQRNSSAERKRFSSLLSVPSACHATAEAKELSQQHTQIRPPPSGLPPSRLPSHFRNNCSTSIWDTEMVASIYTNSGTLAEVW